MTSLLLLAWLASTPLSGDVPVHSPAVFCSDGQLAFIGGPGTERTWYRVASDGAAPAPLYCDPPYDHAEDAWWSPDGSRLAYLATVGGQLTLHVWEVGTAKAQAFSVISESGRRFRTCLAWSRDGQRLAFSRENGPDRELPYTIFVLSADGSGPLREVLTPDPPVSLAWDWTADKLAHVARGGGRRVVFVTFMDPPRAVVCSPHLEVFPRTITFSPDGRRLLFGGTGEIRSGVRLFVSRPDGMVPAERSRHDGYLADQPPAWSPDGRWLAFTTGSRSRPERGRLQLAPSDDLYHPKPIARSVSWATGPVFSPDSRWLAVTSYRASTGDESRVVLVNVEDPERVVELAAPEKAAWPVFSPDGLAVAVVAGDSGALGVYLVRVPGE